MRIGLLIDDHNRRIEELGPLTQAAESNGIERIWFSQLFGWDVLTLIGALAPYTSTVRFGVSIVPTYPRHPIALAMQALSVQSLTGNRLLLGIGTSHPPIIEGMHGLSMDRPADHMREYVQALQALMSGEPADYQGERITARASLRVAGAKPPELILAALGPRMLSIAGEHASGTVTAWVGPELIESYIVPRIGKAAAEAGRRRPSVIAGVCVAVTEHPDITRRRVKEQFPTVGELPAYRAVLDRAGSAGPEETVALGDESEVAHQLDLYAAAGATEIAIAPVGTPEEKARTIAFVSDYSRQLTEDRHPVKTAGDAGPSHPA